MASCRRRIIVLVTGARKLFCWAGPLEPVAGLEVFSRHLFRLPLLVHVVGAVLDHDVAEAAFLPAGNLGSCRVFRRCPWMFYNVALQIFGGVLCLEVAETTITVRIR